MAVPISFVFFTVLVSVLLADRLTSAAPRSLADPRFFLGRAGASAKQPTVTQPSAGVAENPFDMSVSKIGHGSSEFFVPRNNWFFAPRSLAQSDSPMLDEPQPLYYKRMGSSGIGFDAWNTADHSEDSQDNSASTSVPAKPQYYNFFKLMG